MTWIERPDVLQHMVDAAGRQVVVIAAPAGCGKTVLLSQYRDWLEARGGTVAWLTIDPTANDPAVLSSLLTRAIAAAVPAIGLPAGGPKDPASAGAIDAGLQHILASMSAAGTDIHLFIDDVHLCRAPPARELLRRLIRHAPGNVHVIIAGREQPPLPMARMRAEGTLAQIDWSHLRFSPDAARALVEAAGHHSLTEADLGRLTDATEGWAMGLRLAAMELSAHAGDARSIAGFSGRHESVSEYLAEELLASQSAETLDFLIRSSIFEQFSAEMGNAVLGIANAGQIIEDLERSNAFIVRLDRERLWFRYHRSLREWLLKRLQIHHPDEAPRLQRRATKWLCDANRLEEALKMASATQDVEFGGAMLNEIGDKLFRFGQFKLLREAATALPTGVLAKYPRIALLLVWIDNIMGNLDQARHVLSIIEDRHNDHLLPQQGYSPDIRFEDAITHRRMMAALSIGDMQSVDNLCDKLLSTISFCDKYLLSSVHAAKLFARYHLFDCRGIVARARQSLDIVPDDAKNNGHLWTECCVGLAHMRRGETEAARAAYELALANANWDGSPGFLSPMPATFLAGIHYEQDRVEQARALLDMYVRDDSAPALIDQFSEAPILRSRLLRLTGEREQAAALLDNSIDLFAGKGLSCVQRSLVAERVRQTCLDGRLHEAELIAREIGITLEARPLLPMPGASTWDMADMLTWSRLAINAGEYRAVGTLLRSWIALCRAGGCGRTVMQLSILLAKVGMLDGDVRAASTWLRSALVAGRAAGMIRTFADEGPSLRTMLLEVQESPAGLDVEARGYVAQLLKAFAQQHDLISDLPELSRSDGLLSTPLTEREAQILALVSQGIKGRFIAAQLCITEGTVKWYMQQIFDKLDVRTRVDAVKRAREFGFVP